MLILKDRDAFDDNWIYIHDPSVKVGRIQNFKSWSPEMVPDPDKACYGLEYFCFEDDGLWDSSDAELIELAKKELIQIGLAKEGDVIDGWVVRQQKAYPVYDDDYATHVATIREELDARFPNLHLVGRNGMHKYNNQDHAMMTAMLCVENILADAKLYDLWQVNRDAEYHEGGEAAVGRRPGPRSVLCPRGSPARRSWLRSRRSRGATDFALRLAAAGDDHQLVLIQGHRLEVPPALRASLLFDAFVKASTETAVEGVRAIAQNPPETRCPFASSQLRVEAKSLVRVNKPEVRAAVEPATLQSRPLERC